MRHTAYSRQHCTKETTTYTYNHIWPWTSHLSHAYCVEARHSDERERRKWQTHRYY